MSKSPKVKPTPDWQARIDKMRDWINAAPTKEIRSLRKQQAYVEMYSFGTPQLEKFLKFPGEMK